MQFTVGAGAGFASPAWFRSPPLRASFRALDLRETLVLSPGSVPTTAIYLHTRADAGAPVRFVDTLAQSPQAPPEPGTGVVIVRHAPKAWLRWLRRYRASFGRVALLMDDDMPAALSATELPLGYALRTARRHRNVAELLAGVCDELWLSTPELLRRYPGAHSVLCPPLYIQAPAGSPIVPESEPVFFYHGTRAHLDEIRWLVPVVVGVQKRCANAVFEIFGDAQVARLFRGVPRVRIRPWLSWPDYLRYCGEHRFRVGLAPCLDTRFNRARAPVKVFDITRLGAAGIYADLAPYATTVRHGETGVLCPERQDDWVGAISTLLAVPEQAQSMARASLAACEAQRQARAGWPDAAGARG